MKYQILHQTTKYNFKNCLDRAITYYYHVSWKKLRMLNNASQIVIAIALKLFIRSSLKYMWSIILLSYPLSLTHINTIKKGRSPLKCIKWIQKRRFLIASDLHFHKRCTFMGHASRDYNYYAVAAYYKLLIIAKGVWPFYFRSS